MIDLYGELKAVIQALKAGDVPYALCGGLPLMVYRQPRATVDIEALRSLDDLEPGAGEERSHA